MIQSADAFVWNTSLWYLLESTQSNDGFIQNRICGEQLVYDLMESKTQPACINTA